MTNTFPVETGTVQPKRTRRKRLTPSRSLAETVKVAEAIRDQNNGHPFSRLLIADVLSIKPDSSVFRDLITSSNQYGLTEGGYSAERISLTDLGRAVVMPTSNQERGQSLRKVFLSVDIFSKIYTHYSGAKLPESTLFKNSLIREHEVPSESATEVAESFITNSRFVGLVADVSGSPRVLTETYLEDSQGALSLDASPPITEVSVDSVIADVANDVGSGQSPQQSGPISIFITHGSNTAVVEQIRQILTFGRYQPVVAEEQQTTAISVPDKVLTAMRACHGAIIHIETEKELLDENSETLHVLNPNVLIEIGAAMALYDRNFVLLVRKGVKLPSNLQGLYRCDYEGDQLDFGATMRLLQTFNQFQLS